MQSANVDSKRHRDSWWSPENRLRILSRAVEQSPSTLMIADLDGIILYTNPKFTELTGYTAEEVQGQNASILKSDAHPPEFYRDLWRTIRAGDVWRGEFRNQRKDGSTYWELASIAPVLDDEGAPLCYVKVAEDITALRESQTVLQEQAHLLQTHNEELDAFAHTVAHDLKNPLSIIRGAADFLSAEYESLSIAEIRQTLDILTRVTLKAQRIIDALLLLASARREDIYAEPLDMATIVDDALQRLAYNIAEQRGTVVRPTSWPAALGFAPWVEEVWTNYLSNALKYGGDPPRITLGATPQEDGYVRFWVQDNGPGIPEEQHAQLFVPFKRLNAGGPSGDGLGLSIVRRLVERMGGTVGLESGNEGSTFYFTLPGSKDA